MQYILSAIELKKELDSLRPLNRDQEDKIMQKFRLDWNYHSNHLEGNSLTFGETKNLILHGITAQGKPLKDHFEITGHNEALNWIIEVVKEERPLTENFIRELHVLLLKEPYSVDAETPDGKPTKKRIEIGKYKSSQNHVKTSTGEIFRFAEPEETAAKMHDLLMWYRDKKEDKDVNPVLLAAEFHYKFIIIHPFDDGNGRMARILMNFILMTFHYPPVIIKTDDKTNYFFALRQADNGDIEFFIDYIAKNLMRSLKIMIAGAKGENIEEPDDIDKNIALLEYKLKGIGEKIEVFKSDKTLKNLVKNLSPIFNRLIEQYSKFDRFYSKKEIIFTTDKPSFRVHHFVKLTNLQDFLQDIDPQNETITFSYRYISFNNVKIPEFNYTTLLRIELQNTKYNIKIDSDYEIRNTELSVSKLYSENLTDSEIENFAQNALKNHQAFIENKIEEFESKNVKE